MISLAVGLFSGLLTLILLRWSGRLDDPRSVGFLVAVIVVIYPAFAIIEGNPAALGLHLAIALLFLVLVYSGLFRGIFFLGVVLVVHGTFDMLHEIYPTLRVAPDWYGAFCAAVDYVVGFVLMYKFYPRKTAK